MVPPSLTRRLAEVVFQLVVRARRRQAAGRRLQMLVNFVGMTLFALGFGAVALTHGYYEASVRFKGVTAEATVVGADLEAKVQYVTVEYEARGDLTRADLFACNGAPSPLDRLAVVYSEGRPTVAREQGSCPPSAWWAREASSSR